MNLVLTEIQQYSIRDALKLFGIVSSTATLGDGTCHIMYCHIGVTGRWGMPYHVLPHWGDREMGHMPYHVLPHWGDWEMGHAISCAACSWVVLTCKPRVMFPTTKSTTLFTRVSVCKLHFVVYKGLKCHHTSWLVLV